MSEGKTPPMSWAPVLPLRIERIRNGGREPIEDCLAVEASIELFLNGRRLARLRCTPCHVEEMARGFLLTEGWVEDPEQVLSVELHREKALVDTRIDIPEDKIEEIRGQLSIASGCGGGLSRDNLTLDPDCKKKFDLTATISEKQIHRMAEDFDERSKMYQETRCVHSAALFDPCVILSEAKNLNVPKVEILRFAQNDDPARRGVEMLRSGQDVFLSFAEDLGRHNAVDKAVGMLCRPGFSFAGKGLFTSGRVTLDIAAKMARVRAAFIVSRSVPSMEAAKAANEFHIAVVGRLRKSSMKVYSAPWRIKVG